MESDQEDIRAEYQETRNRITVAEAEAKNMVQHEQLGPDPIPFGFENARWQNLLDQMQEGDELWEYCSSPDSWRHLAGRAGIDLVRNGKDIDSIVTLMN